MIHLEKDVINTLQKAIFKDETFCRLFTDYQPELFERNKEEQLHWINERYSQYEANRLVLMFEKYKQIKPFRTKNFEKAKGLEKVTDMGGFHILVGDKNVGYCAYNQVRKDGYTLNFKEFDLNDDRKWNWITLKVRFSNIADAKEWLKNPNNYLRFRMKYNLHIDSDE